jgi:hypothetical protein
MIALDPSETVEVSLKRWQQRPPESRPVFIFHYLTASELRKVQRLRAEAEKDGTTDEDKDKNIEEGIRIGLVGWRNVIDRSGKPVPFDASKLSEILSFREMVELIFNYPSAIALSESDLGKSESPSDSATAPKSAGPVPPASA